MARAESDVHGFLSTDAGRGLTKTPTGRQRYNDEMYHYDPNTALEELTEDATLPNPVHVRDMILRKHPSTDQALELNRLFVDYQKVFGELQKLGKELLKQLAA